MAGSYRTLMTKIAKLRAQALRLNKGRAKAITRANRLIAEFGLVASDLRLGGGGRPKSRAARKRKKLAPKYRGPNGLTWAGRGLMPVWLRAAIKKGKKKEDFLIKRR